MMWFYTTGFAAVIGGSLGFLHWAAKHIIQRHYVPFIEMWRYQITSRAEFERPVKAEADPLTDLERACRFLYLQPVTYGGKIVSRSLASLPLSPGRLDVTKLVPVLGALHERLAGVVIECLHWRDFIERYDRSRMLFYLDPSYFGHENDYGKGIFAREDFAARAPTLSGALYVLGTIFRRVIFFK